MKSKSLFSFIIFLCVIKLNVLGQTHEIGLGINGYKGFTSRVQAPDTIFYAKDKSVITFQPIITYNFVNKNKIDLFVHVGYFYEPRTANNKSYYKSQKVSSYSTGDFLSKSIYVKLGIGKRFNLENLTFISAINIPFEYNYYFKTNNYSNNYDSLGVKTFYSYNNEKYAPSYITGLNLQQSFYYTFYKSIMVGFDINLAYSISISNGTREFTEGSVDYISGSQYEETQVVKYKFQTSSEFLIRPVFNIKYIFKNKKFKS